MNERISKHTSSATLRPLVTLIKFLTYSIWRVILKKEVQYHQVRNSLGTMSRLVEHLQASLLGEKFPIAAKNIGRINTSIL